MDWRNTIEHLLLDWFLMMHIGINSIALNISKYQVCIEANMAMLDDYLDSLGNNLMMHVKPLLTQLTIEQPWY